MRFRFFNTFEPVIPLFRLLLPYLDRRGHRTEAWISDRRYRGGGAGEPFQARALRSWVPHRRGRRPAKPLLHLSYAVSAAVLSLLGRRVDANVFLTQPPLFSLWARVLKLLRRQPYCVVAMDLYPWVAVEAGVLRRRSPVTRVAETLSKAAFRGADRVVVIGRCMARRVRDLGVPPERIDLVRNWADTEVVRPVAPEDNGLRSHHGFGGRFVVMYSGNLGVSHRFDELLEVAARLSELPDVLFVFVGDGARRPEVEAEAARRGLGNVEFLPFQPYERLSEALSMGDVHFVSLRRGFEGLVVPSKAYGVLAAGRPLLYQGSSEGEIARMVEEEEVGIVVEPGDAEALAAAVLRARNDAQWRERAGRRARRVAERTYCATRALTAYEAVLTGLAGGRGRGAADG